MRAKRKLHVHTQTIILIPKKITEGLDTIITEYLALNQQPSSILLEEAYLMAKDTIWIYIQNPFLKSGESTPIYICKRK